MTIKTTMTTEQFHEERIKLEEQGYEWAYPRGGHDELLELKKEHYETGKPTHIWIQIDEWIDTRQGILRLFAEDEA